MRHAAFQVGSIISTTGFASTDFNLWPEFSRILLVLLMFIGACAGSTGGGNEGVPGDVIAFKEIKRKLASVIQSRQRQGLKLRGKAWTTNTLRSINAFIIVYFIILGVSVLLVSWTILTSAPPSPRWLPP